MGTLIKTALLISVGACVVMWLAGPSFANPATTAATAPARGPKYTPQMRAGMLYARAKVYSTIDNDKAALDDLESALKIVPVHAESLSLRETMRALQDPRAVRVAAEEGNPEAMRHLGILHGKGLGVAKDERTAAEWYQRSAEAGSLGAMNNYALALLNGRGVKKDLSAAFNWWKKKADANDIGGMYRVGQCYQNGWGVEKNMTEAISWFRKVAESPVSSNDRGQARVDLGGIYFLGVGVPVDLEAGKAWTMLAVEDGHPKAFQNVSAMYEQGLAVNRDAHEAKVWAEAAVDAGNAGVANTLALGYTRGTTAAPKDDAKATYWFRRAAELGSVPAMVNLASSYLEGTGVDKNEVEARRWMQAAANEGNEYAIDWIKKHPEEPVKE